MSEHASIHEITSNKFAIKYKFKTFKIVENNQQVKHKINATERIAKIRSIQLRSIRNLLYEIGCKNNNFYIN